MTKQEEIREGVAEGLFKFDHPYEEWGMQNSKTIFLYQYRSDKLLAWLHSKGIAIKVDRELPAKAIGEIHEIAQSYTHLFEDYGLQIVAVEPLIEICKHNWIDATNEHVSGTAYCPKCGALESLEKVKPLIKE